MPTGNEPPTQAERDEQPPPIPEKIPEKQPAQSGEMISPVTPVETRYPAPLIPERNARRSVEGPPGQARPPIPAVQSQEPYGRAPSGPQDYPSPARLPSDHKPPNGLGPTKTIDNLKRAAAGVHGAGDLLRGTFNSSIDKCFHEPDSPATQKNEAILERGRYETENQRFQHGPNSSMPPLGQIHETQEPHEPFFQPQQAPAPQLTPGETSNRPRSMFSGMFRKEKSPGMGAPGPPRKLKKTPGVT